MLNRLEFLIALKENKTFLCILFFISFACGLFAFYSVETLLIAGIFTFIILLFSFYFMFHKEYSKIFSSVFFLIFYLVFVMGFLIAKHSSVEQDDFSKINYMKNVEITGRIDGLAKFISSSSSVKFPLKVHSATINGKHYDVGASTILVTVRDKNNTLGSKLKFQDEYKFKGTVSTPFKAQNPSQFDYNSFLKRKGILKTFYTDNYNSSFISSYELSDVKNEKSFLSTVGLFNNYLMRKMHDLRDYVIEKHSKYIKSPKLEVLGGVVFGDDAVIPPDEVKGSFINSGLLHLLAASGLNVALILSIWFCLIYFLNLPYRIKILSGIFVVFFYAMMTGFPPSVVRASVMLELILFGKLIYRETNGVSLIFAAGFLILLFKPEFIMDVGFQLSFLVTLGLIVCTPSVNYLLNNKEKEFLEKIKKYPPYTKPLLLVFSPASFACCLFIPVIAQLWAAPLQAYYFNTFSVYSVFANIAVVPFIGVVSFLGFISTTFCLIPKVSDFIIPMFDYVLNFAITIVLNISNFFSGLPNSIVRVPSPSVFSIIVFYLFVISFFIALKFSFKNKNLNNLFKVVFLVLVLSFIKIPSKYDRVTFFSVGNADNCLIETKSGKNILIDTGRTIYNSSSSAKTVTLEYLYDKNIRNLDTLIVTHFDSDHSGGLIDILENVYVAKLIMPNPECTSNVSCNIKNYLEKNKIKYSLPKSGEKIQIDKNVSLVNFVPNSLGLNSRNETSIVTLVNFENYKFLFMADAGIDSYNSIKELIPNINVLKSAHHGARGTVDDKMLAKLTPDYAILSTGKNPYGHPSRETVELLKKYSKVLSTEELGAIKFEVGDKMKVYNFDMEEKKFKKIN